LNLEPRKLIYIGLENSQKAYRINLTRFLEKFYDKSSQGYMKNLSKYELEKRAFFELLNHVSINLGS
jgi:hypothetical protein